MIIKQEPEISIGDRESKRNETKIGKKEYAKQELLGAGRGTKEDVENESSPNSNTSTWHGL